MGLGLFQSADLVTLSDALDIAEDKTGDFFKFSFGQWKRHRYDVKTLLSLNEAEISPYAFASLNKYSGISNGFSFQPRKSDFYQICLQDHRILRALNRDKNLELLPLLVYVFTHELVHIVRFCNFFQRFEVSGEGRDREEKIVHTTTFDILKDVTLPHLDYILESYQGHRICDLATC